jgi:hypothetical protein
MLNSDLWTVPKLTKLQDKKLEIDVDPADVRLQPGVEDGYEWKPLLYDLKGDSFFSRVQAQEEKSLTEGCSLLGVRYTDKRTV